MKNRTTKLTVIVIFLIVVVVGYYAYLSNRTREQKQEATLTVVQNTLGKSLEIDYPPTPKEVIKYYNEILLCFYNEECTEEEIELLGNQARALYDTELLANNELNIYLVNLKADIQDYKKNERRITSTSVASSASVDFFEKDGYEFARIMCGYNVMEDGVNYPSGQVYLLRRDEEKQWKIYGWEPVEEFNKKMQE
ncbi:MAG: hypothetical protein E7291_08745 [Lachnospiraceae bacterium]|nr:hypothetical protein [Lachnospiraceae bacterium]